MANHSAVSTTVRRFGFTRKTIFNTRAQKTLGYSSRRFNSNSTESVWKLQNVEASYWNDYIATRPPYDATIFNPIFAYHEANNNKFDAALDVGTVVTASDNDTTSLGFAQKRYRNIDPNRLSWTVSRAEDLINYHTPSSFNMITCALTFPLLDTEKALHCMSTLLRPGGTLAIWFYGPPIFLDPVQTAKGQAALYAALDHAFKPIVTGGDPQARAAWKHAAEGMASWLDYIPFSTEQWSDVRRQKWNNSNARLAFFGPDAGDFELEPKTAVGETELMIEEQDPNFWKVDWDIEMLRKFVLSIFPKPDHMNSADEIMKGYFGELEKALGGSNVKVPMTWPAVLVLARKNG
ncbi:hypothetical protein N0V90_001025 [Kalmusia sp. IMI 367209]|nr:hypothetical protein N0V90_001025 [Kalmusia sp. IMI 367209]